ncbi:GTPase activating protein [Kwoniella heveanensis BCC8398]|uniref:GTPase activating protein n=1 Tax=Kwoniella heveanensis BCC8398 TaxID=1296120 RepID=A0A1B9H3J9_9TREE|nr:GTPase activating protein [Kwoniella heveanensis BCC8398]
MTMQHQNHKRLTQTHRDSTLESAGEAGDIFDLYGSDQQTDPRESWRSSASTSAQQLDGSVPGSGSRAGAGNWAEAGGRDRESRIGMALGSSDKATAQAAAGAGGARGYTNGQGLDNGVGLGYGGDRLENGIREELASSKDSEASWAGVSGFMGSSPLIPTTYRETEGRIIGDSNSGDRSSANAAGAGRRWSEMSGSGSGPAPDISITDTTPMNLPHTPPPGEIRNGKGNGTNMPTGDSPSKKAYNYDPRKASFASSISSATSSHQHQHQQQQQLNSLSLSASANRLSPRHPSTLNRGSGSTSTSYTDRSSVSASASRGGGGGGGVGEASMSQTSVAGSAQYPGEEDDAFYVRSTYARLDSEGVHGDGWDPGVERTRGGPGMGKRATVYPASKAGDIGEQEKQYLASLDRYGFVNEPHRNRSETRIALIPTSPLLRIPKLPSVSPLAGKPPAEPNTSFTPSSDSGPSARTPPSPRLNGNEEAKLKAKETERVDKWGKMMSIKRRDSGGNISEWDWRKDGQGAKLPRRVYKGIPDRWRMAAWWTLAEDRTRDYQGKGKGKKPASEIGNDYRNTIDLPSTFDVQIDLDVPRTISGHTMFVTRYGAGQRNLWHVLHAFSQVCETCGYVQGMGPIAATLLCYFDPERAYALLVRLHDIYGMHDIFEPGFPGLLEAFYVQERLMEWLMPDLYQSFQRNMISSSAWGTKWYITLFVNTVPFSQQLRIWDALWLDGRDVMIVTSLAILWAFKDLLSSPQATFESILSLLSSYFVAEDEDAFMRWIRKVLNQKPVREKMDAWRTEWAGLVREGKSGKALL